MMLSDGLRQVLEGLPSRLPLALTVVDATLGVVTDDSGYRSTLLSDVGPQVRGEVEAAARSGKPRTFSAAGRYLHVQPLSAGSGQTPAGALLLGAAESDAALLDSWALLLRAAIESDLSVGSVYRYNVERSKHFAAALRFLPHVAGLTTEADVLRATIQAAAVWFDLDARVYRRSSTGDFVPHMYLPGVPVEYGHRIKAEAAAAASAVVRLTSLSDLEDLGVATGEVTLVPLGSAPVDFILVLAGTTPADAELTFTVIGRVVGEVLGRNAERASAALRETLAAALSAADADSALATFLHHLVAASQTAGGVISLSRGGDRRLLASMGHSDPAVPPPPGAPSPVTVASGQMTLVLAADHDGSLAIQLFELGGGFVPSAQRAIRAAGEVLRPWIAGRSAAGWDPFSAPALTGRGAQFIARLEEEVARARRFNLELALVVCRGGEPPAAPDVTADLVALLRPELREGDLLWTLAPCEVAALLVHSGARGANAVVRRLHERLASRQSLNGVAVRQAVLSEQCATAQALLSCARGADLSGG